MVEVHDKTDSELVKNVKNHNCSDSLVELDRRHSPLCYIVYDRYHKPFQQLGINRQDVQNDRLSIVYKAAKTFDRRRKCKFSTWLANRIRYQCLFEINKAKKRPEIDFNSDAIVDDLSTFDIKTELKDYLFHLLKDEPGMLEIIKLRFFDNLTLTEIGDLKGYSNEWARILINRALEYVRNKIKKDKE